MTNAERMEMYREMALMMGLEGEKALRMAILLRQAYDDGVYDGAKPAREEKMANLSNLKP